MSENIIVKPSEFSVKRIILAIILGFVILFLIFWLFDAPPIENDYTLTNLRSAASEYNESYNILLSMCSNDPNIDSITLIGLDANDVNTLDSFHKCANSSSCKQDTNYIELWQKIAKNSQAIDRLWQNSHKGRDIIKQLNSYDEIADLTEPNMLAGWNYPINLIRMVQVYNLKTLLEFQRDNQVAAIETLSEIYHVVKNLGITARPIATKLICYVGLHICIETTNLLVNQPQCSAETLNAISEAFGPLGSEILSMENCLINEYLIFKNRLFLIADSNKPRPNPFFKTNSTLNLYKNFISENLAAIENNSKYKSSDFPVWPRHLSFLKTPRLTSDVKIPKIYFVYNPIGSLFISILMPPFENAIRRHSQAVVYDDLLQIVINLRLGKPYSLKAGAYSDEYIIDLDKNIIFSPGPDGKPYTDDDIKFEINPEVLGLTTSSY